MQKAKRIVHPGQQLIQHRFIKPSEVLKPQRPHNDLSVGDACQGTEGKEIDECIIALQSQSNVLVSPAC
jgi:hypothetical protein